MGKYVGLWLVCISGILFADAQSPTVFNGQVVSRTNRAPLPDATLTLNGRNWVCDSNGRVSISLPAGRYQLRISHTGFQTLSKEISIPGEASFLLTESGAELEQVVVTAVASATKIKRTPVSVAIVSQKEMNRYTSTNVIDAILKTVPGISAITTGPNISKPLIRGLGYNRVLTLYDGMRQEGQQWGDEHGVEIDQYGISRAEIVKGPASLMYGSDAIAGVVNLIPAIPNRTMGKLHGDAAAEYQANNAMTGASAALQYRRGSFLTNTRVSAKSAANYTNAVDGRVYNTGFKEYNVSVMAGWEQTKSKNYIQANLYDNLQEIPDGSRDSISRRFTYQVQEADKDNIRNRPLVPEERLFTHTISPLHQHIQHYRLYHKGAYQLFGGELSSLVGWQQNRRREYNHPTQAAQPGLDVLLNTLNYELKYGFPEKNGWRFTYGINGMYQHNQNHDATDFPIPDYQLFDIGSYLVVKKEWTKLVLTGGLRVDTRKIDWNDFYTRKDPASGFMKQVLVPDTANAMRNFPAYEKNFSGVSGSLGMVYNFSNTVTLKANLARGYRCPSIPEIGSDGLDPGARIYYIGNRNFNPEFNWQADIGLFLNYPDVDISVEAFNNNISNYIFFQKLFDASGQPLEIVPGNFTYQYKQGSARLYGLEASWVLHPGSWRWFYFQQSVSAINGINTDQESLKLLGDDAHYLPLIPPFRTSTRLRLNLLQKKGRIDEGFIQAELESAATQNRFYAVDHTETATQGYLLTNIGAGIALINKNDQPVCSFNITLNNVFDVAYQSHQNRLKYFEYYQQTPNGRYGIYNMGRNLAVKMIIYW